MSNQIKNRNVFFSPAACLVLALMASIRKRPNSSYFTQGFLGLVKKNLAKLQSFVNIWKCKYVIFYPGNNKILFPNFHFVLRNVAKYANKLDKEILKSKQQKVFWGRSTGLLTYHHITKEYKGGSGLQSSSHSLWQDMINSKSPCLWASDKILDFGHFFASC